LVLQAARRIAGNENVWPALELVEYDQRLHPAMERIFGNSLICRTQEIAKQLPYNPQVRLKHQLKENVV